MFIYLCIKKPETYEQRGHSETSKKTKKKRVYSITNKTHFNLNETTLVFIKKRKKKHDPPLEVPKKPPQLMFTP